jgi:predicted ribonuclease YlaK
MLTLGQVMLLAYDIIAKVPSQSIEREYELKSHPWHDWLQFCTLVTLDYVETMSEKTGSWGKREKSRKKKYSRDIMFEDNVYLVVLKGEAVGPSWGTEKNLSMSLFITNPH